MSNFPVRILLVALLLGATTPAICVDEERHNNLIVQMTDAPGVETFRATITAKDLPRPLHYKLPVNGGTLMDGVHVPPGKNRVFDMSASDSEGHEIYRGRMEVDISGKVNRPVIATLHAREDKRHIEVSFATYGVKLESKVIVREDEETVRYTATVFDADGVSLTVEPRDMTWHFEDLEPPLGRDDYFPCKGSLGPPPPCIELRIPLRKLPPLKACWGGSFCSPPPSPLRKLTLTTGWGNHACVTTRSGRAFCWGENQVGQLGRNTTTICNGVSCSNRAVEVICSQGACNFTQIAAGESHTCALDANQEAWCWGGNGAYQLGLDPASPRPPFTQMPAKVSGGVKFTQISAGVTHTCGISNMRELYCWGSNSHGQAGSQTYAVVQVPTKLAAGMTFSQLSAGSRHNCAIDVAATAYCWGDVSFEVGSMPPWIGPAPNPLPWCSVCTAVPFSYQADVDAVAAADHLLNCFHSITRKAIFCRHSVSIVGPSGLPTTTSVPQLSAQGSVSMCYVLNTQGFCTSDFSPNVSSPAPVPAPPADFLQIDMGVGPFSCAISLTPDSNDVYCWGKSVNGRLGDGTDTDRPLPTKVVF